MARSADPFTDQGYHYPQDAQKFLVTATDDGAETLEIQHFDGSIDEFEFPTWCAMGVVLVATPQDRTRPIHNIEPDDLNPVGTEMQREDWNAPHDEEMKKTPAGARNANQDQRVVG